MRPHPLNSAQTHPEQLPWSTGPCPLSRVARFYWSFHDELPIDGDILTKGEWVVIPLSCRDSIMANLHERDHAGINKAMDLARTCVYWLGMQADVTDYIKQCLTCIKSSNLPVEILQPHEVPPRPWVKIAVDFFQDHLAKKTPNSSRLLQQVPICVPSGICTSFQDHHTPEGTLCYWRHTHYCHVLTMDPQSMVRNSSNLPMILTLCTPHHHPICINPMDSSRLWWWRSRMPTRKLMVLPMLKLKHYFSYMIHPSCQISLPQQKFYVDILHKEQFFQDHQNMSIYPRFGRNSFNFRKNRKKTLTKPTEPKIYVSSR